MPLIRGRKLGGRNTDVVIGYATEEIALRVGETLGGLLNATFG